MAKVFFYSYTGYKVNIPAIFINNDDGLKLIKLINHAQNNSLTPTMKIAF
jgi:hypothetical protein